LLRKLVRSTEDGPLVRIEAAVALYILDPKQGSKATRSLLPPAESLSPDSRISLGKKIGDKDTQLGIQILRGVALTLNVAPRLRLAAASAATWLDQAEGERIRALVREDSEVSDYLKSIKRTRG
ncbi:hypothetical protein, partial [Amycolatopsis lurida]|uniref:hypothetical protein n=1 Tax=Amycolatopsis lurida TaxID=31959 RepID=UPI00366A0934